MFGVVLWSDEQEQKAVIWCEDHGDLAFYRNNGGTAPLELDAGDWVQFDMTMERHQRFAHNPRLVSEGVYPDIADALCAAPVMQGGQQAGNTEGKPASSKRESAQIIPFVSLQAVRQKTVNSAQANRA